MRNREIQNATWFAALLVSLVALGNCTFRATGITRDSSVYHTPAAIPDLPSSMADEAVDSSDLVDVQAGEPITGAKRSSKWKAVRAKHIKAHPVCEACGTRDDLDVHHIRPFHIAPELELDPSNLITLCRRHHFEIGHLGDWGAENPNVWKDASRYKAKHPWRVDREGN